VSVVDRAAAEGVSFIVPVYNGERRLGEVLEAILAQYDGRPFEVIAVDDGSSDGSLALLRRHAADGRVRLLSGSGRGAAAAINVGVAAAAHPIVCQVDQDVVLQPGWMRRLAAALAEPGVGAVQGWYETPSAGSPWARAMGLDLELRYSSIAGDVLDHVCSGNSAYRAEALRAIGSFDESLGYGYDNDVSYRLGAAGWRLRFCREARSVHHWRSDLLGYLRQQYGVGYGRLDLVAKHPNRVGGDAVSGLRMILHAPLMLAVLAAGAAAGLTAISGGSWQPGLLFAGALLAALAGDRFLAALAAARRLGHGGALIFVPAHLLRDVAWALALAAWGWRRFTGGARHPATSMARSLCGRDTRLDDADLHVPPRRREDFVLLVPARDEAANLPGVLAELRERWPGVDVLVIDDASRDGTAQVLAALGVRCLRLREHLGVGGAVRAGLRWARRHGYATVVRVDGDGQHPATEIADLLAPILAGRADAVQGWRRKGAAGYSAGIAAGVARALVGRLTGGWSGRGVSDPTSGFWAFGPAAVRVLADHHPSGYPEPELLLFLRRNRLRVEFVPVAMRRRAAGRTSLTVVRAAWASWRLLLALIVVPLRAAVARPAR
jgi:hypothetical protein